MKILITGANGFLGKNLIDKLKKIGGYTIYSFDIDTPIAKLKEFTKDCDFVYNFAAVHRPKDTSEFDKVNHVFFDDLLDMLKEHENTCPVLYTSSIQATNGTEYGNSKLAAEADLKGYEEQTGARAIVYRLSNVYGRWATPNHHSVVATFCYNLVHDLPLTISDREHVMNFHYVDDVIESFVSQLNDIPKRDGDGIYRVNKIHTITLGELADTLTYFKDCVNSNKKPDLKNSTQETLYITYRSYLENK